MKPEIITDMRENKDILFEGRDTHNGKIFVLGIVLFAIMAGCSLLMIPLVHSLWSWASTVNPKVEKTALPEQKLFLEVHPNHDLYKMQDEYKANQSAERIDAAVKKALSEDFKA